MNPKAPVSQDWQSSLFRVRTIEESWLLRASGDPAHMTHEDWGSTGQKRGTSGIEGCSYSPVLLQPQNGEHQCGWYIEQIRIFRPHYQPTFPSRVSRPAQGKLLGPQSFTARSVLLGFKRRTNGRQGVSSSARAR